MYRRQKLPIVHCRKIEGWPSKSCFHLPYGKYEVKLAIAIDREITNVGYVAGFSGIGVPASSSASEIAGGSIKLT
jgi:hypothetical protein